MPCPPKRADGTAATPRVVEQKPGSGAPAPFDPPPRPIQADEDAAYAPPPPAAGAAVESSAPPPPSPRVASNPGSPGVAQDDQFALTPPPNFDSPTAEAAATAGGPLGELLQKDAPAPGAPGAAEPTSELAKEQERLRVLVRTFVAKAIKGCPCHFFDGGKRIPMHYVVDKSLRNLIVLDSSANGCRQIVCPIHKIEDLYSIVDDGVDAFPPDVLKALKEEESDALFMVVFQDAHQLYRFCLLEESNENRVMFAEAMRILKACAQRQVDEQSMDVLKNSARGQNSGPSPVCTPAQVAAKGDRQASMGFFLNSIGRKGGRSVAAMLVSRSVPSGKRAQLSVSPSCGVVKYLRAFGYNVMDEKRWAPDADGTRPRLELGVAQHIEAAKHTWYMMECMFHNLSGEKAAGKSMEWLSPRRLAHLRTILKERLKETVGMALYDKIFDKAHFATRGGLPGTTAQLDKWCKALANAVNSSALPPQAVALVLCFFEAPNLAADA
eukprot:TRINITY_DN7600_c0_g1_i1.p1 TRINITY_DN7600_c0_g1~~TRINITY_DN7600_c0_g1_i1.p1  ORF type:complete len:496 (-),score=127.33 TRINITY_DN7600_c0_g1_i1:13-1500(-)